MVRWQPNQVLKTLARQSNELNGKDHIVETTYFDTISALKEIANEVLRDRGEINEPSRSNRLINRIMDCYSSGRTIVKTVLDKSLRSH